MIWIHFNRMDAEKDMYGADHTSELRVAGRVVLNVWRLMRHEVAFYRDDENDSSEVA